MTLAKMARESNIIKGFKNRTGFEYEKVSYCGLYAFQDKGNKEKKVVLNIVIDGIEKEWYGNTEAEIKHLEEVFNKWKEIKEPKDINIKK